MLSGTDDQAGMTRSSVRILAGGPDV